MRTLFFDIETGAGVNGFKADLSVALCIGYKWSDEKKPKTLSILDYGDLASKPIAKWDKEMLRDFAAIYDSADLIVGHYSKRFDRRYLNGRMLLHRLPPPAPVRHIDTCLEARQIAAFSSNRLGHLLKILDGENRKLDKGWPEWWIGVGRDPYGQVRKMLPYCKGDVLAVEELYHILEPYMVNKGMFNMHEGCPKCGHHRLQSRGTYRTTGGLYQRFQCQSCGSWSRGTERKNEILTVKDI
jgi:uncharacterized protein YprB with RNaseH-like and TPR domain